MVSSKTLKVESLLDKLPANEGYLIAYSGGSDSTALLHLFASVENVRAIHINHGIQSQAQIWQDHCQAICKQLNISLIIEQAELPDSSENSCRKARYTFFEEHLRPNEVLLTAHHSEDQAETVLLKLMRGTGIKGLCGIDRIRKFAKGYIARPLLKTPPETLKNYLIENKLSWIDDASNFNNRYKRNFLRNEIIPSLQDQFTHVVENIGRSADNSSQTLDLLNHLLGFKEKSLPIDKLKDLPISLQPTLLYHWLSHKNLPTPDKAVLNQITGDFISASDDKHPHYKNKYYQLYRWKKAIYCIQNFDVIDSKQVYEWNTKNPFEFPNDCGILTFNASESDSMELTIKFNQIGQKLQTHKHEFSKSIKQLFQENKVPTWERQNTPFIYHTDQLISLGHDWSHNTDLIGVITFHLQINIL